MPRKKRGVLQHAQVRTNELTNARLDSNGRVQKLGGRGNDRSHPKKLTVSKRTTCNMEDLVIRVLSVLPSSEQALPSESVHHPSTNFSSPNANPQVLFGKPSIAGRFFRKNLWSTLSTSSTSKPDTPSSSAYSKTESNNEPYLVQSKETITSFVYKEAKTSPTLLGQSSTAGKSFLKNLPILFGRPSTMGRFVHNHSLVFSNKKTAKPSALPTNPLTPMSVVCREAKTATPVAHKLLLKPSAMQLTHQIIMKHAKLTNPEATAKSSQTTAPQDINEPVQVGHAQNAIILVQGRHSQDISAPAQVGRSPEIDVPVQVEYPQRIVRKKTQQLRHEFTTPVELRLLAKLQTIIEEAMYDFGKKYTPDILQYQGWDCPEAAELTAWIPILNRYKLLPRYALAHNASVRNLADLLFDVKHLRHAAVHRILLGLSKIESFILIAVSLVELLRDEERVGQLRNIQGILYRSDFGKLKHILNVDRSGQSLKRQLDNNTMTDGPSRKKRQLDFQEDFREDNTHIQDSEKDAKRRKVDYHGSHPKTISSNDKPKELRNIIDLAEDSDDAS